MGFKGGAGALDRLITFQRLPNANTGTADSFGETEGAPVNDICNVRAAYDPAGSANSSGGREFLESYKRQAETTPRFRIRYRSDINVRTIVETHQIIFIEDRNLAPSCQVTRTYDIKSAEVIGRREEIHFQVEEVR